MPNKKCPNCGTDNDEAGLFCDECGETLTMDPAALPASSTDETSEIVNDPVEVVEESPSDASTTDADQVTNAQASDSTNEDEVAADDNDEPVIQTMYLPGDNEIAIREGDVHIISRTSGGHPNATVKIDDPGISAAGVKVEGRDGKVLITDMGSGTVVVGNVIEVNTEMEVRENGVLQVGKTNIFFG